MDELVVTMSIKEHKRIFKKITKDIKTKCWNWTGSLDQQGYGLLWYRHRTERIHRIIYAFYVKSIPRGIENRQYFQIDHLCRNHKCCNPKHLELVTQQVNGLRGIGLQAINARKTHCKYGHPLPKIGRRDCRICDSVRKKTRMQGSNREYWLKKARESAKKYRDKHNNA